MNQTSRSSRLATNLMLRTRRKPRVVPQGTIRFDQGDPYFNTREPIRRALSAASVALAHGDEWHREMLERYRRRRDLVVDALGALSSSPPRPPQGTFYIFARHPGGVTSEQMTEIALKKGVAVRPGSAYGPSGEGFVRIAFSLGVDDVTEGMARLSRAFHQAAAHTVRRGSNASRTALPKMLADSTASTMATPGHSTSQMEWNK